MTNLGGVASCSLRGRCAGVVVDETDQLKNPVIPGLTRNPVRCIFCIPAFAGMTNFERVRVATRGLRHCNKHQVMLFMMH